VVIALKVGVFEGRAKHDREGGIEKSTVWAKNEAVLPHFLTIICLLSFSLSS
jgi:hypothetical protein